MPPVEVVCFDLDDTLCVPALSDGEFHREVAARAGVEPPFTPAQLRAVGDHEIVESASLSGFYTNLYRAAARRDDAGIDPADPLFEALGDHASDLSAETGVEARVGAERALEYAGEHHRVALVTSGRRETQLEKVRELGIEDEFDRILCCHPDGAHPPKPDPAPFESVLAAVGAAPEACVVVGDSLVADVAGAHRVGGRSVWTPVDRPHESLPDDPEPAPTRTVRRMSELPEELAALDGGGDDG